MSSVNKIIFDYFGVLATSFGVLDRELIDFIERDLAGKYHLVVLSNMTNATAEGMLGDKAKLFEKVFISGEIGYAKPDLRAYQAVLREIGEPAESCLMIDDSQANLVAAEDIGMATLHYQNLADISSYFVKR